MRLLEGQIKANVLEYLRSKERWSNHHIAINEMPIAFHERRVDLVTLGKDIQAYEIKSEADDLHRLEGQVETYLNYFDKVTIVADQKHISKILELTPEHVAVWICNDNGIKVCRRGKKGQYQKKENYLHLMHLTELKKTTKEDGYNGDSYDRRELTEFAETLPMKQIRTACLTALKRRYEPANIQFWNKLGHNKVSSDNISMLSVSAGIKTSSQDVLDEQMASWVKWLAKQENFYDDPYMKSWSTHDRSEDLFGRPPRLIQEIINSYKSSGQSSSAS